MNERTVKIKVWDVPTRLFHWGMLVLLGVLWWSASESEMEMHQYAAYGLMILVAFRLAWGFWGSQTAKFSDFIHPPQKVLQYIAIVRKEGVQQHIGHNPLGGYMVLLMLGILLFQIGSGMFATDEVFTEGPLVSFVSHEFSLAATWLHKKNFDIILILAVVHVFAVLVHHMKGDKLISAMFTGYKRDLQDNDTHIDIAPARRSVLLVTVIALMIGYWLILPLMAGF